MKIVIVRNTPDAKVIQYLGKQNEEFYRESDIIAVQNALIEKGYEVSILEGDIDLIPQLHKMFSLNESTDSGKVMVFNLAYGVQGECRYTQIPSLLELAGIPYVGSGPRAHTIALDKYLTKVLISSAGLPTPAFQLFTVADGRLNRNLDYPLIVKPQFESTSFGVKVVKNDEELKQAVASILTHYKQPALVETYIAGMEVNCGIIGNEPPEALPVLEIDFGKKANHPETILSFEIKRDHAIKNICPARISNKLASKIQELSVSTFRVIGCKDAARVDFRIDRQGNPYILELNSMVAIHKDSTFFHAGQTLGMDLSQLFNRLLDIAIARYSW